MVRVRESTGGDGLSSAGRGEVTDRIIGTARGGMMVSSSSPARCAGFMSRPCESDNSSPSVSVVLLCTLETLADGSGNIGVEGG